MKPVELREAAVKNAGFKVNQQLFNAVPLGCVPLGEGETSPPAAVLTPGTDVFVFDGHSWCRAKVVQVALPRLRAGRWRDGECCAVRVKDHNQRTLNVNGSRVRIISSNNDDDTNEDGDDDDDDHAMAAAAALASAPAIGAGAAAAAPHTSQVAAQPPSADPSEPMSFQLADEAYNLHVRAGFVTTIVTVDDDEGTTMILKKPLIIRVRKISH